MVDGYDADFHPMDKISLHHTMRFMTVLMPWGCKKTFSGAYMLMVNITSRNAMVS